MPERSQPLRGGAASLARFEKQLETLQESLGVARRAEEAKKATAEKKAKQATEQAAADAHMSEAGACELVELVMKMQARFTNKSDTGGCCVGSRAQAVHEARGEG
jgi:hypothetical protein